MAVPEAPALPATEPEIADDPALPEGRGRVERIRVVGPGSQRAAPEGDVELLEGVLAPRRAEHPRGLANQPPLRVPDLDLVGRIAVAVAGVKEEGGRSRGQRDGGGRRRSGAALRPAGRRLV